MWKSLALPLSQDEQKAFADNLENARHTFFTRRAERERRSEWKHNGTRVHGLKKRGRTVPFLDTRLRLVSFLGGGGDGSVYLTRDPQNKLWVWKLFEYGHTAYEESYFLSIDSYSPSGIEVDVQQGSMRYPYFPALPLDYLFEKQRLTLHQEEFIEGLPGFYLHNMWNQVLSLEDLKIVTIDLH